MHGYGSRSGAGRTNEGATMSSLPLGKIRSPLNVVLLSIVTLGIYWIVWEYKVFAELKAHRGEGIGGGLALVFVFLLGGIPNWFILPSEVGNGQETAGIPRTVRGATGWWCLLPIVGGFIWLWKTQHAMNAYWVASGASYV
jgi:Domain of unknown function (DUF4234)